MVKVKREALHKALSIVGKAVSTRSPLPAAQAVHLSWGDGVLVLTGTNLDVQISIPVECETDDEGKALVPEDRLSGFVAAASGETLQLSAPKGKEWDLRVKSPSGYTTIKGIDPESFPFAVNPPDGAPVAKIDTDTLRTAVPFSAADASRPVLNGVCIASRNGKVEVLAADGYVAVIVQTQHEGAEDLHVIIQRDIVPLMPPGTFTVRADSSRARFDSVDSGITMIARLIDGKFPNIRAVLPARDRQVSAQFDRKVLDAAIKLVLPIADDFRIVEVEMAGNSVSLTTRSADVGEAQSMAAFGYGGEVRPFKVDGRRLSAALRPFPENAVFLRTVDDKSPIVVDDDANVTVLVMPMTKPAA